MFSICRVPFGAISEAHRRGGRRETAADQVTCQTRLDGNVQETSCYRYRAEGQQKNGVTVTVRSSIEI